MRVVVVADVHVGSAFGMWPPDLPLSSGGHYEPNIGQRYLYENWLKQIESLAPVDMLVLNGDIVDGIQPRSQGRYLIETDIGHQVVAALRLLEPLCAKLSRNGSVFVTRGTGYHDLADTAMETLARELGAQQDAAGRYAWEWLLLEVRGLLCDIAHSQARGVTYRSSPLEREGQFADMGGSGADVIVRSHNHVCHWHYIEGTNKLPLRLEVSTPGLQLQTAYAQRTVHRNRLLARNLGFIVLEVREDWASVEPHLFPHPPLTRAKAVE